MAISIAILGIRITTCLQSLVTLSSFHSPDFFFKKKLKLCIYPPLFPLGVFLPLFYIRSITVNGSELKTRA